MWISQKFHTLSGIRFNALKHNYFHTQCQYHKLYVTGHVTSARYK